MTPYSPFIIFLLLAGSAYGQTVATISKPDPRPKPVIQITVNTSSEIELYADCPESWIVDVSSLDDEQWYSRRQVLRDVKRLFCRHPTYAERMWKQYEAKYWAEQGLHVENGVDNHGFSLICLFGAKPR